MNGSHKTVIVHPCALLPVDVWRCGDVEMHMLGLLFSRIQQGQCSLCLIQKRGDYEKV
ncbi:unnamed protein product [Ectocarpus sp. 6 AP-2014]